MNYKFENLWNFQIKNIHNINAGITWVENTSTTVCWKSKSEQKLRHAIISDEDKDDEECFKAIVWDWLIENFTDEHTYIIRSTQLSG